MNNSGHIRTKNRTYNYLCWTLIGDAAIYYKSDNWFLDSKTLNFNNCKKEQLTIKTFMHNASSNISRFISKIQTVCAAAGPPNITLKYQIR